MWAGETVGTVKMMIQEVEGIPARRQILELEGGYLRDDLDDNGLAASAVRCFGFATPACVDEVLARRCERGGLVTAVVLHDDVVPRLTATSLRRLMSELLRQRETFDGRRRIHDRGEAMRAEHKALHQLVVARERP